MKTVSFLFWLPRCSLRNPLLIAAVAGVLGIAASVGQPGAAAPGNGSSAEVSAQSREQAKEDQYTVALKLAQEALRQRDYDKANSCASAALAERPGDQAADDIMTQASLERICQTWVLRSRDPGGYASGALNDAQKRLAKYGPFQAAMGAARKALNGRHTDVALKNVERALKVRPWDTSAQELKNQVISRPSPEK